jgi:tetratricopeptide (TPR) repeat protein
MNSSMLRRNLALALSLLSVAAPLSATCGGGGGGGMGGASPDMGGGGGAPATYFVAWKVLDVGHDVPSDAQMVLYWFPTSPGEARASALVSSRGLSLASERCVAPMIVPTDNASVREKYKAKPDEALLVLAELDGTEVVRNAAAGGKFDVHAIEKSVKGALDQREDATEEALKAADRQASGGDKAGAIAAYQKIWASRCLFPSYGKKAAKALKKLGAPVENAALERLGPDGLAEPQVLGDGEGNGARAAKALRQGLDAELAAQYRDAEKLYQQAASLDPADTTPLRFLGELYRHQTGEWDKARTVFERILAQPADPVAKAVALHGLGKMTIHAGRFADGLALFDRSLEQFPLAITYRNLAVYWFSERQAEKAAGYMRQALALAPENRYNQIFAAVYLAAAGHKDEALAVAKANEDVLEASYNLAAIWAQSGDRAKAMELLRRHFYQYERFDAVRAMEMKEARDDYMFASLHQDQDFVELTKLAHQSAAMMSGR